MRGAAGQLKELEKKQKSRATRSQRDALDRALVDLAGFYRDVLVTGLQACGNAGGVALTWQPVQGATGYLVFRNLFATAEEQGTRVGLTLLTHGHPDHAEGAARFAELTGTKVRALDPALRLGDEGLAAGDVITTGGLELRVVPTPGHTADSLCFHLPADRAVLTGDTILGRGTTVVAHPDGRLGDYLDSLRRLRSLTVDDGVHTVLPGHGPVLEDAQGAVEFYLAHRAHRLAQVETAVENGHVAPGDVVAHVYADVDRSLWPAAELSVRAQLDYLREHGLI